MRVREHACGGGGGCESLNGFHPRYFAVTTHDNHIGFNAAFSPFASRLYEA